MKLYRNLPDNVGGKYNVIDNRTGERAKDEFFCIKLKDRFAQAALIAYAKEAQSFDPEYAGEVHKLAMRSGPNHPECKFPD
jgi:hypothetical protein